MRNQVVIFEGPDRCGKTEIGQALSVRMGYSYLKNKNEEFYFKQPYLFPLAAEIEGRYLLNFLNQVRFQHSGIILDRSMPSEWVYAQVYNRSYSDFVWDFDSEMAAQGGKIVYCYKDHYSDYHDDLVDFSEIDVIKKLYMEYLSRTKMPVLYLKTDDENLGRQLSEIESFLDKG